MDPVIDDVFTYFFTIVKCHINSSISQLINKYLKILKSLKYVSPNLLLASVQHYSVHFFFRKLDMTLSLWINVHKGVVEKSICDASLRRHITLCNMNVHWTSLCLKYRRNKLFYFFLHFLYLFFVLVMEKLFYGDKVCLG